MKKRLSLFAVLGFLVTCGPGTDVKGFPNAYANAYCHFAYHCCTPADRATSAFSSFTATASQLGFDDESSCDSKLGDVYQSAFQQYQDSVQQKRLGYNQNVASTCIQALSNAANPCSYQAYLDATGATDGGCTLTDLFTGLVPAGGSCTEQADCSIQNSVCNIPNQSDAGTAIVASVGTCTAPPTTGQPCTFGQSCAVGNCCDFTGTCVAYVSLGATCDNNFGGGCTAKPCDPSTSFCSLTNPTCTALVSLGGTCTSDSQCQTGLVCTLGKCANPATGPATQYDICGGNPDGI
jgi:hypothetical protein